MEGPSNFFVWVASEEKENGTGKDYLIATKQYLQHSKEPETLLTAVKEASSANCTLRAGPIF